MATTLIVTLTTTTCYRCGVAFGMDSAFYQNRLNDHGDFYCPNGHGQHFLAKSEADRLRDELAREKHKAEQAQADAKWYRERTADANERTEKVKRSLRATKAVVTRTKKKIVAGRCPCCSFKVKDLAEHMKSQHPKYDPEKAAAAIEAKAE